MRFHLRKLTLEYYLQYMRRQSKHVQHVHALLFAGAITALIASFVLYTDYGFWHETYRREPLGEEPRVVDDQTFGAFLREAKENFQKIGSAGTNLLEGKETFTR